MKKIIGTKTNMGNKERLSIIIDSELKKKLKKKCIDLEIDMSKYVMDLIKISLKGEDLNVNM